MPDQPTPSNQPDTATPPKRRGRFWTRLRRVLVYGISLILGLVILFQIPAFQNWIGGLVVDSISETLGTEVRLERVNLAWLDALSLDGLYIEDKYGDTLLYSEAIRADFNFNPIVLLNRGLEIEALDITSTRFVIRRDVGDTESNLQTALKKLFPPKDEPGKPLNLNLKELGLYDIEFIQADSVRGQHMQVQLEEAVVRLNQLDLPNTQIELSQVSLYGPKVQLTNFTPKLLSEDALSPETIEMMDSIAAEITDTTSLFVVADRISIANGNFQLNNFRKEAIEPSDITAIDFARLGVSDIDLEILDFQLQRDTFSGELKSLSLREKSGFQIDNLSSSEITIAPTRLIAKDLSLITPNSQLSDLLDFRYRRGWTDWANFEDRVRMNLNFDESTVAVRDIMYFARKLRDNRFFRENRNRSISLDGIITGRVNSLSGEALRLALDGNNYLSGGFSLSGITRPGEQFLELDLEYAYTDMNSLRRLINRFNPPPAFDRLGTLRFSGQFDGFFTNFVAYGNLQTDIGSTELNMQMNLTPGAARAEYRGDILLQNFDLGTFLNNPEFGTVSMTGNINNGRGLIAETAEADLSATIADFTFRDYTYTQAEISGQLNRNFFDGAFNIEDDNIDFNFLGKLDFRDSISKYDFAAEVARLDLKALNLSKDDLVLSGLIDLNLRNQRLSDLEGDVSVGQLKIVKDGSEVYQVDTISAYSTFDQLGRKVVVLDSDLATGRLIGDFDLDRIVGSLKQFMLNNYPGFAGRLNIKPPRQTGQPNNFSYELNIIDSKGLNYLIAPTLGPLKDILIVGNYDENSEELGLEIEIPQIQIGKLEISDLILISSSDGPEGDLSLVIDSIYNNGKPLLERITLLGLTDGDSLQFGINYAADRNAVLDKVNLDGLFYLPDSINYRIQFDPSTLVLFQDTWQISGQNAITFRKGYVNTRDFSLRSSGRTIRLRPEGRQGLNLSLENFQLGLIDSLWAYPNLDFSGNFSADLTIADIFKMEDIQAILRSDTFLINGDDYGWMRLDAKVADLRNQVTAYLSLNRDTSQLIAEALFNLQDLKETPSVQEQKNYLDLNVAINGYPLELADYWVGGSVSNIDGIFDASMDVKGPVKQLDVDGFINARNGTFTVDYLKTSYTFNDARVNIDNTLFDASGTILYDKYGNTARVSGGITHQRLKQLGLGAELNTDRFLALDLKKGDNELFYGRALGSGRINFSGNFKQTDIYVRAEVGAGSSLVIPTDQTAETGPISDIRFVNKRIYVEPEEEIISDPTGVSLEMEVIVNEQAEVEIIFDEEVGDLIRGNGRGNLRILVPRDGDMQMFGDYTISDGNYLFTLYNVVNKLFSVRPGGRIIWSGDPFGARIDLRADYEKLSTPILNFIQEYLVGTANQGLVSAASNATEVDLTLILKGQLLQPEISFDLSFPQLDGQLETFANNKKRLLQLDQNELNRQVFGLIIVGQFLPADLGFNTGGDFAINTLSEWAGNYFSLLLNNLITDAFGEDAFISSIDFDLAYNRYNNGNLSAEGLNSRGDVFELTLRKNLGNRWTFVGDINVLSNNQLATSGSNRTFVGNDFALEYAFNDRRTFKLRIYQRRQLDIVSSARTQVGVGLSWRKEFNSLREFFGKMKEEVQEQR